MHSSFQLFIVTLQLSTFLEGQIQVALGGSLRRVRTHGMTEASRGFLKHLMFPEGHLTLHLGSSSCFFGLDAEEIVLKLGSRYRRPSLAQSREQFSNQRLEFFLRHALYRLCGGNLAEQLPLADGRTQSGGWRR